MTSKAYILFAFGLCSILNLSAQGTVPVPKSLTLKSGLNLVYTTRPNHGLDAPFEIPISAYPTGVAPSSSQIVASPSLGNFKDKTCVVIVRNQNSMLPELLQMRLPEVTSNTQLSWSESAPDSTGQKYHIATLSFDASNTALKSANNYVSSIIFSYRNKPSDAGFLNDLRNTLGGELSEVKVPAPTDEQKH